MDSIGDVVDGYLMFRPVREQRLEDAPAYATMEPADSESQQ